MITPSFGLTATERVLPRLALDWTTGLAQPGVDVTRAGVATHVNDAGIILLASADTQRVDYSKGVSGLLVEENRTNNLTYSGYQNANGSTPPTNWSIGFGTATTTTSDSPLFAGAKIATHTGTSQRAFYQRNILVTAGVSYTLSTYLSVAPGTTNVVLLIVNLTAGFSGSDRLNATDVTQDGRYSITFTPVANDTISIRIGLGCLSNATGSVSHQLPQLEAGAFATSYIPTEATAVTRNADVATMTGTNFSDWYNAAEGTILNMGQLNGLNTANAPRIGLNVSNGATTERIHNFVSSTTQITSRVISSNANQAVLVNTVSTLPAAFVKTAVAYKANDFAASSNSSTVATDNSGVVPTLDRAYIGSSEVDGTSSYMNGTVQKIMYWPQRLTNAELQAFTK
jgi:hypothetical protein